MARTRNTEVTTEEEVVVTEEETTTAKNEVTVVYRAGSRVYSRALHGDNFVALAKEFAEKKKGTLV